MYFAVRIAMFGSLIYLDHMLGIIPEKSGHYACYAPTHRTLHQKSGAPLKIAISHDRLKQTALQRVELNVRRFPRVMTDNANPHDGTYHYLLQIF
jgi:hypothetical protein